MDPFTDSFIDYGDNFENFSLFRDADFYIASPDSASTKTKTNSHSPELQNSFPSSEQLYMEQPACNYNYQAPRGESPVENPVFPASYDEKISDKSKRIMKHNAAKERTKVRQEVTVGLSFSNMYGQEFGDNGDVEDNLKKKMALKMKNRIAAQNSRDRKKIYTQQLEEANAKLIQENMALQKEKETLVKEINRLQQSEARLLQENQLFKSTICPGCGKQKAPTYDEESINNRYPMGPGGPATGHSGHNGLSSPILSRFPSGGRKLFTFITFACFVSLVLFVNVQDKREIPLTTGLQTIKDRGLLELEEVCENPDLDTDTDHEQCILNRSSSLDSLLDLFSDDSRISSPKRANSEGSKVISIIGKNSLGINQTPKKAMPVTELVCPIDSGFKADHKDNGGSCTMEQFEAEADKSKK